MFKKPRFEGEKPRFEVKPRFEDGQKPHFRGEKPRFEESFAQTNPSIDNQLVTVDVQLYRKQKPHFRGEKPRFEENHKN